MAGGNSQDMRKHDRPAAVDVGRHLYAHGAGKPPIEPQATGSESRGEMVAGGLAVGFACSARFFGHICSKTPNMGWIVDWRGWEGPEVPGMEVRFFPMAARSTVRGSQLEED